jgi:UDP-N-acetylglucosamine pyrophosphorylase
MNNSNRIFNTNNLWINLPAIKRVVEDKTLNMEIIVNNKVKLFLNEKIKYDYIF